MIGLIALISFVALFGYLYWRNRVFLHSVYNNYKNMMHLMKTVDDLNKKKQKETLDSIIDVENKE